MKKYILEELKKEGFDEEDIEEIKTTVDVSLYTLIYSLEKLNDLLEKSSIPDEMKSYVKMAFIHKDNKK